MFLLRDALNQVIATNNIKNALSRFPEAALGEKING